MTAPLRIAMWSGPRSLSTAMLYAFAARPDCTVVDEPFYAAYLAATGLDHPMRTEILASQPTDPAEVAARLLAPTPRPVLYVKLMTHHMLPDVPTEWMDGFIHVFLLRHPARVIASYARKRERPTLGDIGFAEQASLFEALAERTGKTPIVVDATAIRAEPEARLADLCQRLGLPFDARMLHWEAGPKAHDGVWAPHWYGAVHRSTGFDTAEGPLPELSGAYARLAERSLPYYEVLRAAL